MKLLVLTISDNILHGQEKPLLESLTKHGYEYDYYLYGFIFGSQYKVIKDYVDNYKGDATHILYTDCWDTLAIAPVEETIRKFNAMNCKMLISAEKAYFPDDGNSHLYPEVDTVWKYVNGGGCMFEIEFFKSITTPYPEPMMDPYWLRDIYLQYKEVKIDHNCEIFQCISHSNPDEWEIEDNRIKNKGTNTQPIFIHGSGRTDMQWVRDIAL